MVIFILQLFILDFRYSFNPVFIVQKMYDMHIMHIGTLTPTLTHTYTYIHTCIIIFWLQHVSAHNTLVCL